MSLANPSIVVTGGTGALGRAVVAYFVEAGARVHVPWVVKAEVDECRAALPEVFKQVTLHEADLSEDDSVKALFGSVASSSGGVDVLCNIVGGFAFAALADTDPTTWQKMLTMNATTCFLCTRHAVPLMQQRGGGRIVNVTAGPALNRGAENMSAYGASKAAVLNFTQSLAKELAGEKITANAIVPTIIDTPANRAAMPDADTSSWLPPEKIARVIGFLAGEDGGIVTGAAVTLG